MHLAPLNRPSAPVPNEQDLPPEIGHILFIATAHHVTRDPEPSAARLGELAQLVHEAPAVRAALAAGDVISQAAAAGLVLIFRGQLEQAAACALEIGTASRQYPDLPLRMGLHSGPIHPAGNLGEPPDSTGLEEAERVLDCGDAGHILLSAQAANDLASDPHWHPHLYDLGKLEVEPGRWVHLVNLFTAAAGNAATPARITNTRVPLLARPVAAPRRNRVPWLSAAIILIWLGGAVWWFGFRPEAKKPVSQRVPPPTPIIVPEKTIAVLPFENPGAEKENSGLDAGVQDEIRADLSRIADLKVISSSSVTSYRPGAARDLSRIGQQLGVANLLVGSAQRTGETLRIKVQLREARTGHSLWAQSYEGDLAKVFSIESDIARAIAARLQATLTVAEEERLAAKPTDSSEAYLRYLKANELLTATASLEEKLEAEKLYTQAIVLDTGFALVRARASILSSLIYLASGDPVHEERARTLAEEALHRAPHLGEAHLALGLYNYRISHDDSVALQKLELARGTLPNNAEIPQVMGAIYRRQGRWRDALAAFVRVRELDPRRAHFGDGPETLRFLRQWQAAREAYQRGLQLEPQREEGWLGFAYLQYVEKGNATAARATLEQLPAELKAKAAVQEARWDYAMAARDFTALEQVTPDRSGDDFPGLAPTAWFQGCAAIAQGEMEKGRSLLAGIKPLYQAGVHEHPDDPLAHFLLGKLLALLGEKEEAIQEARRAVQLCPESLDAVAGPRYATGLAFVYAWTGEREEAVNLLSRLLTTPAATGVTMTHLRLGWEWEPLRADPRFQALLAKPQPVTVYR